MFGVFVPFSFCNVFRYKTVLRFDLRKVGRLSVLFEKCIHSIDHVLDKFYFSVSESVFVGDVVGIINVTSRFSSGASWLDSKFFASPLQCFDSLFMPSWENLEVTLMTPMTSPTNIR